MTHAVMSMSRLLISSPLTAKHSTPVYTQSSTHMTRWAHWGLLSPSNETMTDLLDILNVLLTFCRLVVYWHSYVVQYENYIGFADAPTPDVIGFRCLFVVVYGLRLMNN